MVLSLRIKNYKSILDLTIPMTYAEKKAPNGYKQMELLPFLEEHEIRTIPALVLYGANASGKSTIVQAFASLVGIIRNRYIPKSVPPNALHPNNTITSFTLDFMDGGRRFLYVLEVDGTQIVTERLEESGQEVFEIAKRTTRFSNLSTEYIHNQQAGNHFLSGVSGSRTTVQNSFHQRCRQELCWTERLYGSCIWLYEQQPYGAFRQENTICPWVVHIGKNG